MRSSNVCGLTLWFNTRSLEGHDDVGQAVGDKCCLPLGYQFYFSLCTYQHTWTIARSVGMLFGHNVKSFFLLQ